MDREITGRCRSPACPGAVGQAVISFAQMWKAVLGVILSIGSLSAWAALLHFSVASENPQAPAPPRPYSRSRQH